jgi:Ser/Thr protein kinase RdoA (MazF antagonist)
MELPWSESVAWRVCDTFMVRAGMSTYHPTLISFRQNAIFHIPGPDISLRIYGPGENQTRATLMVISARWLKERNFPAVRLSPIEAVQPFDLLGYQTSVWQWVVADEPRSDSAFAYGRLLRRFHDLPATDAPPVPVFDQMTRIRQRLDRIRAAEIISKQTEAVLTGVVGRATAMADSLGDTRLGRGILHGDAMPGNALQSGGEMVMIDLDSVCAGSREWDLVPMYVSSKRFSGNGERRWRAFLEGYGVNEGDLPDLQAASIIKQLSMTIYLCLSAGQSASIDAEIAQRIRMWETWDLTGRWTTGFSIGPPERSVSEG